MDYPYFFYQTVVAQGQKWATVNIHKNASGCGIDTIRGNAIKHTMLLKFERKWERKCLNENGVSQH